MTAITTAPASHLQVTRKGGELAPVIVSGSKIPRGAFAAINSNQFVTTAARGLADNFSSGVNKIWSGYAQVTKTGAVTTSSTNPEAVKTRLAADGSVEYYLAVTGLAGTNADTGADIVWQTENRTFTLTRAAFAFAFGRVVEKASSTYAWVRLLTAQDLAQFGITRQRVHIGVVTLIGTTATTRKQVTMPFHGKIEKVGGLNLLNMNTSAGAVTVSFKINNGTSAIAMSGGVITIATGHGVGIPLSATAISGVKNIVHEGYTLDVVVTPATAGKPSAGQIELYAIVQARLGT